MVKGLSSDVSVALLWVGIELLQVWLLKGWLLLLLLKTAVRIKLNCLWQGLLLLKTQSLLLLQHHVLLLQGALLLHQLKGLLLLLLLLDVQRLLLALQVQVLLVFQRVDQVAAKAPALKNIFWLGLTFPLKHLNVMIFVLPQCVLLVVWEERGCRKKRLRGGMRFISNDRFHNCRINCEGFLVVGVEAADLSLGHLTALVLLSLHLVLLLVALGDHLLLLAAQQQVSMAWDVKLGEQR